MNAIVESKLDCFQMLTDMERAGVSNAEAARRLGISKTRLHRCKMGEAEMTYSEGTKFIELHALLTKRQPRTKKRSRHISLPFADDDLRLVTLGIRRRSPRRIT